MTTIISTIYIYTILITLVVSDAFWNNLPILITATVAGLISLYGAIRTNNALKIGKENKEKIEKVSADINGHMTTLLKAKDEILRERNSAILLEETKAAARNEGKLEAIKEAELKNMTPPQK